VKTDPSRREAIELLAGSAAAALAGCATPSDAATPAVAAPLVLGTEPLPPSPRPWPVRDPFLFCVHHEDAYPAGNDALGPAASLAGRELGQDFAGKDGWRMYHGEVVPGFPAHPHRGFETVTVVREGLLDHADSLGSAARYGRGDVQWLTAGRGIQHAEMFPLLSAQQPNPVELFQIWLNLPAAKKMSPPWFSMLWAPQIPREVVTDAHGRTATITRSAGADGAHVPPPPPPDSWAADPGNDVAIWTIALQAGATWTLPPAKAGTNRSLFVFAGARLRVGDVDVPGSRRVDLTPDRAAVLTAVDGPVEALLLQGRPIGEPVAARGPFVMNTPDELRQAFVDYRATRFGGWPWDRDDPVHGREERFAKLLDGRIERPS
jgi:redox-sensitive bicupin YhaK (pirin superfamily)